MDELDKLFLQQEMVLHVSSQFDLFRIERYTPYKATFRCHICGDSQRNRRKKRGAIVEKEFNLFYNCKNCNYSDSFLNYLKEYNHNLYNQYFYQVLRNKPVDKPKNIDFSTKKIEMTFDPLRSLQKITAGTEVHSYLKGRKFTDAMIAELRLTDKFYAYINTIITDKFDESALKYDHPRIVIPLMDSWGSCIGVQGRIVGGTVDDLRYITIMFKDQNKIYGMDKVDMSKPVYVLEGPFDAMFLDNAVAMAGTDADLRAFTEPTIILDNQPRNRDVVKKYDKYIASGHKIVIWPTSLKHKDINDMVEAGMALPEIKSLIAANTFKGLMAKTKFNAWRKI